ncbi:MAG TPA: translation initiation factor IF-2 [Thiothrix sp.]|nr:translation initiation factor IF-2 [Thiothrix sp.]
MSEIIVKQLAQIVGTSIDVMLKQLQDAGVPVSSESDSITDEQKLKLLEFIRSGSAGQTTASTTAAKPKLSMSRRNVSERKITSAHSNNTVNVEVRRKKRPLRKPAASATTTGDAPVSKSEALTKKLAAERQALQDSKRGSDEVKADKVTTEQVEEESVVEEVAEVEATETTQEIVAEIVENTEEVADATKAKETEVAQEEPAPAAEEKPAEPVAEAPNLDFFAAARKHKAEGANRAKEEAASLLKKRPSRKPKITTPVAKDTTSTANTNKNKSKAKKPFQGRGSQLHMEKGVGRRRKKGRGRQQQRQVTIERDGKHGFEKPTAPVVKEIEIPQTIVLSDLAKMLSVSSTDVIKQMMGMGVMATINQSLDQDTAILVTEELGHTAIPVTVADEDETILASLIEDTSGFEQHSRPPVVTIMGHVDHGKTSLLDYIRDSRVTAGEAGGITQHIGAYHVNTPNGIISFLDTPGHAAFTAMRSRGANATDIVIVVVAADDSVMPQTKEAIEHTRAAGVPLIVAINKMDKENADPERVKSDLSALEVIPEDWGGDDVFVEVSAITGKGVDDLLDSILLVSEMQDLQAPTEGAASGLVIEASIEKGRGAVATVLVQSGTLHKGDMVLCGQEYGRIRAMLDDQGKPIESAGPSIPVSILGLSGAPDAGVEMVVLSNERKAREVAELRRHKERDSRLTSQQTSKLEALFANLGTGNNVEQVNIIIKADVQGSVEALKHSLNQLSTDEVKVNIVSSGVGGINESDVTLAQASDAIMIAFNVRADSASKRHASESGVEIRYYSIIYEAIDDVRDAMSGLLAPELREEFIGIAEVKDVFRSSAMGAVAGCLIIDGHVSKGLPIRVLRDDVVVYEGELESLRRHKDDVKEVRTGTECGIAIKDYNDVQPGDKIECFKRTEVARKL